LRNIPKNKREIFHHQKIDISNYKPTDVKNDFLVLLENAPTISEEEADEWKKIAYRTHTNNFLCEYIQKDDVVKI